MKLIKKITALVIVFSMLCASTYIPQRIHAQETDIELPEYYTDPMVISDADFFGVWGSSDWTTSPMLDYEAYPGLEAVENSVRASDYTAAKEELLEYYRNKCAGYSMKMQGDGSTKQYLDYIMYKNNMLNTVGAGVSAVALTTVDADWGWVETDITSLLTSSNFHKEEKTFSFILTALNKDDSVIEIKSKESDEMYAPRVEASVNGNVVEFPVEEDAYISAGDNTYVALSKQEPEMLKVAESATSIGKLENPVDENTFRTYLKFNFDKIVKGDTVGKAVLKFYARINGDAEKKDMLLFKSGETAWQEATISWGCGDITHNMYSFDGDPMPGWDMEYARDNAFANARIVTNPIRFEDTAMGVLGYYHTTQNEEVIYNLIRMLISYVTMKPDPAFNNNLSTAQRGYSLSRLVAYAIQSPMMTAEVFTGFVKYFKTMGDYLESAKGFNSSNNWGVYQSSSLLGLAWQYEEIITAPEWEETAFERLAFMCKNVNFPDGGSVESAVDYSRQSLNLFASRLATLVRMVGKDSDSLKFSEEFWEELYKQAKFVMDTTGPGFVAPQWGDDGSYNENYKSVLKNAAEVLNTDDLLWATTDGKKGTEPAYKSILYPVKGMAVMRSDWSDEGLWLHINNDKARDSHGHADDLSVIVFANGRYLLADPLIYLYDPADNPIRQWLLSTRAHNTVMINNTTQNMPNKDDDPGVIEGWESNNAFDYVKMMTETYSGFKHTRDVMFLKNKLWIINDLVEPDDKTSKNQYEQLWHFIPEADISIDTATMETRTNFGDSDIRVIPVDASDYQPVKNFLIEDYKASGAEESYMQDEQSSGIKVGYYSAEYGKVTNAEYSSYRKTDVVGDTSFSTVLLPVTVADDYDVETTSIETDLDSSKASAFKLNYVHKKTSAESSGIFYNLFDKELAAERSIEGYSTDGETMYVENEGGVLSSVILREGTHVADERKEVELIKSNSNIGDIAVKWQSKNIYIEAMNEIDLENITIYTNGRAIDNVYLNGTALESGAVKTQGRYIYFGDSPIIQDIQSIFVKNSSKYTAEEGYEPDFGDVVTCDKFGYVSPSEAYGLYDMYFTGEAYSSAFADIPYRMVVSTKKEKGTVFGAKDYKYTFYIALDEDNYKNISANFEGDNKFNLQVGLLNNNNDWCFSLPIDLTKYVDDGYLHTDRLTRMDLVVGSYDSTNYTADVALYLNTKEVQKWTGVKINTERTYFYEGGMSMQASINDKPAAVNIYASAPVYTGKTAGYTPVNVGGYLSADGKLASYAPNFVSGKNFCVPADTTVADILAMTSTYKKFELRNENGEVLSDAESTQSAVGCYIFTTGTSNTDGQNWGLYSKIYAEKDITLTADAENKAFTVSGAQNSKKTAKMIVARYEGKKLAELMNVRELELSGCNANYKVENYDKNSTYKAFLWEFGELLPIVSSVEF